MFSAAKIAAPTSSGYNLTNSLRFRASASAYLSRTPSVAGNRSVWTWSGWVKRGKLGTLQGIFGAGNTSGGGPGASYITGITFNGSDQLFCYWGGNGAGTSTAVFRDPSAWYHLIVVANTTTLTCYMNGVSVLSNAISGSGAINDTQKTTLGSFWDTAGGSVLWPNDTYMAEVNFIDGQALTPSSFGSVNATTGVWQPAKYSGTYGTNGFYLPFSNTASTTTLGYDFSGNSNNWTTNNISLTTGSTYDSMTDVPTLTSATVANYPVLNVLQPNPNGTPTYSNGNLFVNCASASSFSCVPATMLIPTTGKWYAEFYLTYGSTIADVGILGINDFPPTSYVIGTGANSYAYRNTGNKLNNTNIVAYGSSYATGDTIGVALDMGAGTLTFYKNNTSQGVAFTGLTSQYYFAVDGYNYTQWSCNFGQQPFTYTPPTGFVALNAYNLPTGTILQGNKYMDATLYTGNGSTQSIVNAGAFQPDLVWAKSRSIANYHILVDSVRGATNYLSSNATSAQATNANIIASINSNGFTLGSDGTINTNASTDVAWQWQAGKGTTSTNTNGSITSTVSVNASAGFSIQTWTAQTSGSGTVGHSLGVVPSFIITKATGSAGTNWYVYTATIGASGWLLLNTAAAAVTGNTAAFGGATPTSTVFTNGAGLVSNGACVSYCWAAIAGYSAFGSYTGNGNASGPFIYTGFLTRFVLIKRTDGSEDWFLIDTARNTYNSLNSFLWADTANAEQTSTLLNVTANGFQVANATQPNASGGTYIYAAFASAPFKNSLAF